MNRIAIIFAVLILPLALFAQGTVTGTVTDASTGDGLAGANVVVGGTSMGAAADEDGYFVIENVPDGTYTLTASVIGYHTESMTVTLPGASMVDFVLEATALELSALEVFASRATRNTPVAYSNIDKEDLELRLGSQDIPMALNFTPSVYATMQGGGAGDARMNVRGFHQTNVSVMLNGVPVNDMEWGGVYWSNWDGVSDATNSIQLQRGLSAVNLATPSIGGTMNILTDPAAHDFGGRFKQELGSGTFLKTTVSFNTGLINDKFAASATVVRKTGDGYIDKVWTDSWAYFLGLSFAASEDHRFELFALGAPQRHGQRRWKQNIGAYDADFAKDLDGYDEAALEKYPESSRGSLYNENWNKIKSSYKTKEYYYMYGENKNDRHDPKFLNESENYYHKPQVSLHHYFSINETMRLSSVGYFSGGSGGGTGTFGDITWDSDSEPTRIGDWDLTYERNVGTVNRKGNAKPAGESIGYLRNSINRQWTFGLMSKLRIDISEELKTEIGIDWRTAEIVHGREVRNLLGGTYAVNGDYTPYETGDARYEGFYNEFDNSIADARVGLGDVIDYSFTNTVDWFGVFGQAEYTANLYSLYGMAGVSMVKYFHTNHFFKASNYTDSYIKANGKGEVTIDADRITSMQARGGGLYRATDEIDVYANFGYVEKLPVFDAVIDDGDAILAKDPKNEKYISAEGGVNFRTLNGALTAKVNGYFTMWRDRTVKRLVQSGAGTSADTDLIFLTGLDQDHIGVEFELAYQPMSLFRINGAFSFGLWEFKDDATGRYRDYSTGTSTNYTYAVKDLKVGNAPQTMLAVGATVFPVDGASIQGVLNWYDRHWAEWDPISRQVEEDGPDRAQSWEAPGYFKIDLHGTYNLPVDLGNVSLQAFFHVFNVLDETYIQDAIDNSQYQGFDADHDADDAEVYMGLVRSFNVGINVNF
jgi:hypothetical protein